MKKVLFLSAFLLTFLMTVSSYAKVVAYDYGVAGVDQAHASVRTADGDVVAASHSGTVPILTKYDDSG